jgi:1-acyl-sn-glycerol-3-phosphate acyltransferase
MGAHKDVVITLKKSLKWLPVLGWVRSFAASKLGMDLPSVLKGMQFFGFIFLDRSWASDRLNLAARLSTLGRKAEKQDKPLSLIIYPEGTLVSENTRPISKKYADKMGIVCHSPWFIIPVVNISPQRKTSNISCFPARRDCSIVFVGLRRACPIYV